jgi:hypothetical protein
MCEPFTREGRGCCLSPRTILNYDHMGGRGKGWRGRKRWLCGGLRAGAEREAWTRVGVGTDGRSKQTTSRVVCLGLRGADVGFFGRRFRVVAYVMMENHETAEDSLNGVLNVVVLGRE